MHPAMKILIGALMIATGAYTSITFLDQLTTILLGGIGPLLILIGAFIVWLESDEWKMSRQEKEKNKKDTGLQEQLNTARKIREKQEEQKESETEDRKIRRDYSDAISGTVEEAKATISNMSNPNYNALIAAERRDKNRKTLLQWLERQKENN